MFGIPFDELLSCDFKPASVKWLKENGHGKHHFRAVADLKQKSAWCTVHGQNCCCLPADRCDLLVTGPPCTPFTTQRANRGSMRLQLAKISTPRVNQSCLIHAHGVSKTLL
eukprot:1169999-Amphidinium_carterae.4